MWLRIQCLKIGDDIHRVTILDYQLALRSLLRIGRVGLLDGKEVVVVAGEGQIALF